MISYSSSDGFYYDEVGLRAMIIFAIVAVLVWVIYAIAQMRVMKILRIKGKWRAWLPYFDGLALIDMTMLSQVKLSGGQIASIGAVKVGYTFVYFLQFFPLFGLFFLVCKLCILYWVWKNVYAVIDCTAPANERVWAILTIFCSPIQLFKFFRVREYEIRDFYGFD